MTINAAGNLTGTGGGTNVSGRNITLTTSVGGVGTMAKPLVIQGQPTLLANGGFENGFVTVAAPGNIGLLQVNGDMVVNSIQSATGDVYVDVANGSIYDERGLTPAQLLSQSDATALWNRLQLTSSSGVGNLTSETVNAFQMQVDSNYQQYWNLVDDGTINAGMFTLDSDDLDMYRDQATAMLGHNASDAEVQTYANDQYQTLAAFFVNTIGTGYASTPPFMAFQPNYQYTATSAQQNNLTKNAAWTNSELQYFVSQTALQAAVGLPVPPTTPTIAGNNVTLDAAENVGEMAAPVFISINAIQNGTLTSEQSAALALAAAPGDVDFVGLDSHGNTVTFSDTGSETLPPGVVSLTGVQVEQQSPLYIGATGAFNSTASNGVVFVQSILPDINVGYVSAGTDASLIAPRNILSAGTSPSLQIKTGGNLQLLASAGDLAASHTGASHTPLAIQVGGTLISAGAGLLLDLLETTGDLRFQRISSGGDSFITVPNGSLLQEVIGVGISAGNITITAENAIGASTQAVTSTQPAPGSTVTAIAQANIWLSEANATMNVYSIKSQTGDVTLSSDDSILDAQNPLDPYNPLSGNNTPLVDVIGNNITLSTNTGSIGLPGNYLDIDTAYSGPGVLTSNSFTSTYMDQTSGNLRVMQAASQTGDVVLATLAGDQYITKVSAAAGSARVIASGSIYDATNGAVSIINGVNIILEALIGMIGLPAATPCRFSPRPPLPEYCAARPPGHQRKTDQRAA